MAEPPGRILGIDYGSRRVGLAISDPMRLIATGAGTWENDERLMDRLRALVADEAIGVVVVGMPYAADGGKGGKGAEVQRFLDRLSQSVAVRVETWDESYTTVNAHRAFIEGGMKRKKRREKARVDEMAARLLLQEYLENNNDR